MTIFVILIVAISAILIAGELGLIRPNTYTENLESYISRGRPQHAGDVDRLTREFEHRQGGKFL